MVLRDLERIFEAWAPKELAWERDNVGVQIGASGTEIRRILVALDVTDEVIAEARRKRIDLIVTHHPLFFHPLRAIRPDDRTGRLAGELVRNGIALYSAHTNLDFTRGGVSEMLAEKLGLGGRTVLEPAEGKFKKVAVFVPEANADGVADAMAVAGAGSIGNYDGCSFRSGGIGTYRANAHALPYIGRKGVLERTPETRIEMIVPVWKLNNVLNAMRAAHPYEEVAYDVYDLAVTTSSYGAGTVGHLPRAMTLKRFLGHVKKRLGAKRLRFSAEPGKTIRRVAVCGGSGSDLLETAVRSGADAFVTSDVRYHTFQAADGNIALVDAGHFETEQPAVGGIVDRLRKTLKHQKSKITVEAARSSRNVVYFT